jgi:Protein of unknown function (DUF1254)
MADAEQVRLAAEAYIYGYPLVYDLKEVACFVEGGGSLPFQAPYNAVAAARQLLGPETKSVSPNNDTLDVGGQCDVRQGPLVLHVPDTRDRYYVLQFVDAWTNNFAYIGRGATGTAEADLPAVHDPQDQLTVTPWQSEPVAQPRPRPSARSCACTSPNSRSWTEPMSCPRSGRSARGSSAGSRR